MTARHHILLGLITLLTPIKGVGQNYYAVNSYPDSKEPSSTIFLMPNVYPAVVIDGDTVACMWLKDFVKYSPITFRTRNDQIAYSKLVRDVKKTLPYAKQIANIITETYEIWKHCG